MISLTVATFNGAPMAQAPSAQFDELGGSIGRADNNQLVLPDPDRTISRVHARIVYRNGSYVLQDCGSNPVSINNRPLGNGQESPIKPGDQISIGGYAIKVAAAAAASAKVVDPFADFAGLAAPAPSNAPARNAPAGPSLDPLAGFGGPPSSGGGSSDPFASLGAGFGGPPAPAGASSQAGFGGGFGGGSAPAGAAAGAMIPDDWDPFAGDAPGSGKPKSDPFGNGRSQDFGMEVGGKGAGPLIPDFPQGGSSGSGGDSLDSLFGLGPNASSASADPFANTPLQAIHAQPNMAASDDPLRSLNSVGRATATAASDARSELNSPFDLPPMVIPPVAQPAMPPPVAPPAPTAPAMPIIPGDSSGTLSGAVVSWGETAPEGRTIIRSRSAPRSTGPAPRAAGAALPAAALPIPVAAPPPPAAASPLDAFFDPLAGMPPAPAAPSSKTAADLDFDLDLDIAGSAAPDMAGIGDDPLFGLPPAPPAIASNPPAAAPAPARAAVAAPVAPAAMAPAATSADIDALLTALREGIGVANLPIDRLTPQVMKLLGQMIFQSVQGTVDLLVARAALKREVRAEVTMIVAKENNPLKFSPTAEVALEHLLKPPARGFMPPDRALQDAYDDLRAHQFGFLAGMRAALEGVLKRFDPAVLESKLSKGSVLSSMIPGSRKARMWDVFQEMYGQISTEAADDFHELFGKEFLRAYEAHIDQLKDRR